MLLSLALSATRGADLTLSLYSQGPAPTSPHQPGLPALASVKPFSPAHLLAYVSVSPNWPLTHYLLVCLLSVFPPHLEGKLHQDRASVLSHFKECVLHMDPDTHPDMDTRFSLHNHYSKSSEGSG